jgi:hypothetical protein
LAQELQYIRQANNKGDNFRWDERDEAKEQLKESYEEVKTLPLTDTNQLIFDRYAELAVELTELMPEDFEARAQISGEMRGIKYVIDLLSNTKFL